MPDRLETAIFPQAVASRLIDKLFWESKWFECEPYPEEMYRITKKDEAPYLHDYLESIEAEMGLST